MDHKREHRTPPLARVMGVGRQQQQHVYVCEGYVVLDQCDEPPSLFVFSVCAYGSVVGYFWCFSFLCEFCFLYCDDVRLGAVYEVF